MRLTLHLLGVEVFDIAINEPFEPDAADDEPVQEACTCADEFEPYQDAGTTGSTPIGFCPSPQPEWERPLNRYDEPDEGSEDV